MKFESRTLALANQVASGLCMVSSLLVTECQTQTCSVPVTAAPRTGGCNKTLSAHGHPSKGAWQTLVSYSSPELPHHPTHPRGTTSDGPAASWRLLIQNYCCAKANNSYLSPFPMPFWLKHRAVAQVNYRPALKITGCNSLAWVERMIDLGIADLPCEPGKPWIALWSLWLYSVLQSCLLFQPLLFTAPVAVLAPSWAAA